MEYILEIRGQAICPYCLGNCKYLGSREIDDNGSEVDLYECKDCKKKARD